MPTIKTSGPAPRPKKSLGQNFLINPGVAPKMIEQSGPLAGFGVLEIGPGHGALTKHLVAAAERVLAIELDRALAAALPRELGEPKNLVVVQGDVLELPLDKLIAEHLAPRPIAVFGNLPYYITSPIIMRLLESRLNVAYIVAMVQKEAAARLCAAPGSRASGAVTLAVHYYSEPEVLFDVAPGSFYPAPKVNSSVIKLALRARPPVSPKSERAMFALVKAAFSQRRKRAVNAVSGSLGLEKAAVERAFSDCGVDPNARAENLALEQFAALSDRLARPERAPAGE